MLMVVLPSTLYLIAICLLCASRVCYSYYCFSGYAEAEEPCSHPKLL